jgi:hypothetical protein
MGNGMHLLFTSHNQNMNEHSPLDLRPLPTAKICSTPCFDGMSWSPKLGICRGVQTMRCEREADRDVESFGKTNRHSLCRFKLLHVTSIRFPMSFERV